MIHVHNPSQNYSTGIIPDFLSVPIGTLSRGGGVRESFLYIPSPNKGLQSIASRANDLSFSLVAHTPSANRGCIETPQNGFGGEANE